MARILLIVPSATYRAKDFLVAARRLGVEVVVGSEVPPAHGNAGGRHLTLSLCDPNADAAAVVAHDLVTPVDAVVAVDDAGTVVAAEASRRLGLPHNPPEAVAAARDKLAMRTRLRAAEVPQPAFAALDADAGDGEVRAAAERVGLPCVVKPTTLSGSQGVLRADTPDEAVNVFERVRRIAASAGAPDAPLLLERFVAGDEVAVEAIVDRGALHPLAIFDKPDPLDGPAFEETIYVTPSRHGSADLAAVLAATTGAVDALGLRDGPVHAEVRVREGRASVIEVAARTIGGLCSRALSFSTGRSLEELVIAHALGLPLGDDTATGASGVLMIPIPRPGTLQAVEGVTDALAVPGVVDVQITIAEGRPVAPVPEGNRYLGFVFARERTPERVERALRRAWSCLRVLVDTPADVAPTTA